MGTSSSPIAVYEGDEPFVFVCYARADFDLIYPELLRICNAGLNVWYDAGIPLGSEWSEHLGSRIESCTEFLFFATPNSVGSEYCRREIGFALDQEITLLAVHLEPVALPSGLKLMLSNRQALLKYQLSEEEYARKLLAALSEGRVAPRPSAAPRSAPAARGDKPTIAIMPFRNLSSDPEQEFFSEGISEDILNRLAQHKGLVVKARTSSFALKAQNADIKTIARTLGVSHVLEGSVQKAGNRVRVMARLIQADDETQIWSSQYTREFDDVFLIQDDIGSEVFQALHLHLLRPRLAHLSVPNREAYNAYLLGRYHMNRMDPVAAMAAFKQAVGYDPDYADAHAAMAGVQFGFRIMGMKESQSFIQDCVTRALAIEPGHVLANQIQASLRFMVDLDFQTAIDTCSELWRAHPDQPMDNYAEMLRSIGCYEQALRVTELILERDPLSAFEYRNQAMYLRDLGRYEEAGDALDQAERLGLHMTTEQATLAFERQDADDLERLIPHIARQLGEGHWLHLSHQAALDSFRGDLDACRRTLATVEATQVPAFLKWLLALFCNDLPRALQYFALSLANREHPAFTWSQGSVGMRRMYPWYYDSVERQQMLREFKLDDASIARLRVPEIQ
ncbi:MAG: FlgO family outer membrane protein [Pseudomonadales bacterium]